MKQPRILLIFFHFFPQKLVCQPLISGEAAASPVPTPLHFNCWMIDCFKFSVVMCQSPDTGFIWRTQAFYGVLNIRCVGLEFWELPNFIPGPAKTQANIFKAWHIASSQSMKFCIRETEIVLKIKFVPNIKMWVSKYEKNQASCELETPEARYRL